MFQHSPEALRIARLASTGRLALACALELRRLIGLASGGAAAPPGSLLATQLRDTLGSAGDITRRLLSAAQRPAATEIIDLGDLVEEVRELLGLLAGPGAVVVIVRGAARVRVVANRGDLEQILVNLVDAPCGTAPRRIAITTAVVDAPDGGPPGLPRLPAVPHALLSLVDDQRGHGAPVAPPCTRCGSVPTLGLPLVRAIAAAHRGGLVVTAARDGGTEHRVLLPLAPSSPAGVAGSVAAATLPSGADHKSAK